MSSSKRSQTESPVSGLKNEASRQRWELFHQAIAHAKQSNSNAMQEATSGDGKPEHVPPVLTIAK
jgi:hypothetical protein